ncbi:hypothetical protein [Flavobacterium terrae]|uniref:Lipoprotein n=1 Tax=Flavobacterium terrae TaxID=415425 RepID=A0A1M6B8B5_9FLAO|nr:hypothetical protein [Flavobacterium terrae]SHI44955.1 hypothetical protein SAMN05444363_0608 [Flavobacterium terrae]
MRFKMILSVALMSGLFFSCDDKDDKEVVQDEPQLIVKFKFNPNQERLDNFGQPSTIPTGHAAQTPIFNKISSHYLEFAQNAMTQIGDGAILYHGMETNVGGANAFDFSKAKIVGEGEVFLSIPIKNITPGSYEWARCSLSYQDYNIKVLSAGTEYNGTLASFVGRSTYITSFTSGGYTYNVNANKDQGFWAFGLQGFNFSTSGQAPAGATTVPNPINSTSPIPPNSCVVTGKFVNNLVITGNETKNIEVTLSLSVNNSFEWEEVTPDGKYEPSIGENVVDMGLRGLIPSHN